MDQQTQNFTVNHSYQTMRYCNFRVKMTKVAKKYVNRIRVCPYDIITQIAPENGLFYVSKVSYIISVIISSCAL